MTDKEIILVMLTKKLWVYELWMEDYIKDLNACRFYQFRRKRIAQKYYEHYRDKVGLLNIIINEIKVSG